MKTIAVTEYGGPDVLRVVDLPEPHAGPGQVRIRVRAATVNPADAVLRAGWLAERFPTEPPYVPGMDVAGVLDEVGEGVTLPFGLGERVIAVIVPTSEQLGGYAEYVVAPAASVVRAPAGATDAEASTLLMNALTARQAIDVLGLKAGQTVVVTGAAGAVGGYVVPLAKADGLRVVAMCSPKDEELVRELGADVVVHGSGELDGADGLVDAALIGPELLPVLRDGATFATVRAFDWTPERGIHVQRVKVSDDVLDTESLSRLRDQAEQKVLRLRVARTFPAEDAAEAHRLLEAGGIRGRLVLEF